MTRSASFRIKRISCSTRMIATPNRALSSASFSTIRSQMDGWIPSVGSSSKISLGRPTRQRASARILLLAPGEAASRPLQQILKHRKLL